MSLEFDTKPTLAKVTVSAGDSGRIGFDVNQASDRTACFCLGVRKSGSTMLNKLVLYLARRNDMHPVDIAGTFFKQGYTVADWLRADMSEVLRPGNIYMGFRSYPANLADYAVFQEGRKILMFRDPRDALVSQYFSDAYSHSLPSQATEAGAKASEAFLKKREQARAMDIDTYVLEHAKGFENTLMAYAPMLDHPSCLTLRYEDYVFQKKRLIHKILRHFEWQCQPGHVENLLKIIDAVPQTEDEKQFVRKVIPGDHREKLDPKTIRTLDNRLARVLELFDYA